MKERPTFAKYEAQWQGQETLKRSRPILLDRHRASLLDLVFLIADYSE